MSDVDGDSTPKAPAGRPRKLGKRKITHPIMATGKGRGRPKRPPPSVQELKDMVARGEVIGKPKRPKKSKGTGGKIGRPRKEKVSSDGENDDEIEAPRPVGRPPTGAVNLNILRTGRGQGRPKKSKTSNKFLVSLPQSNKNISKKKPGRPSKGGMPYQPTGKPRGRPKVNKTITNNSEDEEKEQSDDGAEAEDEDENNSV